MFTFISSRLSFIEKSYIPVVFFPDTKKYAKIAGVAFAIISSLTALYFIYRHFNARKINQENSPISPNLNPVAPKPNQQPSPKKTSSSKKNNPIEESPIEESPKNSPSPSKIDEEYAKKLQEQFFQEDESFAKKLQQQFDNEANEPIIQSPKSLITPPPSSPKKIDSPKKVEKKESPKDQPKPTSPSPFTKIDEICGEISEKTFMEPSFSAVKAIGKIEPKIQKEVLGLLNEIVAEFEKRFYVPLKIQYGDQVPSYFANVEEQGSHDRKYLSLVGIRNLLLCGPSIIDDFRDQKYLGGEHHYAPMKGLRAFKYYTGNLVDLDTEIDAENDVEAIKIAEKMIVNFGRTCGITESPESYVEFTAEEIAKALPRRKLDLPKPYQGVYSSSSNTDRSDHGVWKRLPLTGSGKTSYYVNVPNCDIVVLATLRLPYMMAELAYLTKRYKQGKLMKEFYDTLFNKGLSTKCFNDKAREFLIFYHDWKAKLEEVATPEEEARQKLEKGLFGEALKNKDPNAVIKEAYDRIKLLDIFDDSDFAKRKGFDKKGRSFEEWKKDVESEALKILKEENLWENVLYRSEVGKDYFLLNQTSLNNLLKDYFNYIVF